MANNKEPIAKKCRSLDISPAVMGYGNKKSTRNLGKKSLEEVEQKLAALGLALRANDE